MNTHEHRELRELLGWFAIGRADAQEAVRLQAHLDGCPACRAELEELRGTVTRLQAAEADRIDDVPTPPAQLGDRVVAHVLATARTEQPPRSGRLQLVAAGLVILVVGVGAGWMLAPRSTPVAGPPTEPVVLQVVEPSVHASAQLINHTWGVEIQLTADGFVDGEAYRVDIISTTGDRSSAGEFVGTGSAPMVCNLNSAVLRPQAAGFEITDENGAVVLRSEFV